MPALATELRQGVALLESEPREERARRARRRAVAAAVLPAAAGVVALALALPAAPHLPVEADKAPQAVDKVEARAGVEVSLGAAVGSVAAASLAQLAHRRFQLTKSWGNATFPR
jgi:hypothetical protein